MNAANTVSIFLKHAMISVLVDSSLDVASAVDISAFLPFSQVLELSATDLFFKLIDALGKSKT